MSDANDWLDDPAVIAAAVRLVNVLDAAATAHGHKGLVALAVAAHCSNGFTCVLASGDKSRSTAVNVLQGIAENYGVKTEFTVEGFNWPVPQ